MEIRIIGWVYVFQLYKNHIILLFFVGIPFTSNTFSLLVWNLQQNKYMDFLDIIFELGVSKFWVMEFC
jgi:hypothetical protein